MLDYIKLNSVTFWAGILLAVKGLLSAFGIHTPLDSIPNDAFVGLAAVGLRKAVGESKAA